MHVPPHWNLYIAVQSADEIAKRASELGGTVLVPPFDVYNFGRMAVIQDLAGATCCIWQANEHKGTGLQNQQGTFCWADLNTPDQKAAQNFYGDLFGWSFTSDPSGYLHIKNAASHISGIPPEHQRDKNAPPHWMIYLQTDCDASTEKAKALGASVLFGPVTLEKTGRFTILTDPQKAVFALFQPIT